MRESLSGQNLPKANLHKYFANIGYLYSTFRWTDFENKHKNQADK